MKILNLPLYRSAEHENAIIYKNCNLGLIFEKFFDAYCSDFQHPEYDVIESSQKKDYKITFFQSLLCKGDFNYYKNYLYAIDIKLVKELKSQIKSYTNEQDKQSPRNYILDGIKNKISLLKGSIINFAEELNYFKKVLKLNSINDNYKNYDYFRGFKSDFTVAEIITYVANKNHNTSITSTIPHENVLLEDSTKKQFSLVKSINGNGKVYKLSWHMVTGMGNPHPVENGFLWHSTLGVPYIPGSQVKGIVRSLIEQYYDGDARDKNAILFEWFGSEEKKLTDQNNSEALNKDQTGRFIFFDAIPIEKPSLVVDIMTPHMGKWYANGDEISNIDEQAERIPADWHDPTPIPFLAVKEAKFLFTIAERSLSSKVHGTIEDVFEMLNKSLEYLGAGAKTQTGYGYMSFDDVATKNIEEEFKKINDEKEDQLKFKESLLGKSELAKEFLIDTEKYKWKDGQGYFINDKENGADKWLHLLEKEKDSEVLLLFKNLLEELYKGICENFNVKNGKKYRYRKPKSREVAKGLMEIMKNNIPNNE